MSELKSFKQEISLRLKEPWKQTAFTGVFLIVIILAGFGIFFPFIMKNELTIPDLSISLGTYFVASIVSSSLDLSLSVKTINKASYIIYTILVMIIMLLMFLFSVILQINYLKLFFAILGFILSILIWIIANSEKDIFDDVKFAKKLKSSMEDTNNYNNMLNELNDDKNEK